MCRLSLLVCFKHGTQTHRSSGLHGGYYEHIGRNLLPFAVQSECAPPFTATRCHGSPIKFRDEYSMWALSSALARTYSSTHLLSWIIHRQSDTTEKAQKHTITRPRQTSCTTRQAPDQEYCTQTQQLPKALQHPKMRSATSVTLMLALAISLVIAPAYAAPVPKAAGEGPYMPKQTARLSNNSTVSTTSVEKQLASRGHDPELGKCLDWSLFLHQCRRWEHE